MSKVETILTRMMNETDFVNAVFDDADKALAEYNLSTDEVSKFKSMSHANFKSLVSLSPEERKSFSTVRRSSSTGSLGETFVYVKDEGG